MEFCLLLFTLDSRMLQFCSKGKKSYREGLHIGGQGDEVVKELGLTGIHPETQHLESATTKHVFCFH